MTKADIVEQIAYKTGIERSSVLQIVETYFKVVKDAVTAGETIYVRGFGNFTAQNRAAKTGRNITTNTFVRIPEQTLPKFKPAQAFVERVKSSVK